MPPGKEKDPTKWYLAHECYGKLYDRGYGEYGKRKEYRWWGSSSAAPRHTL